jgi:hypothetical protein
MLSSVSPSISAFDYPGFLRLIRGGFMIRFPPSSGVRLFPGDRGIGGTGATARGTPAVAFRVSVTTSGRPPLPVRIPGCLEEGRPFVSHMWPGSRRHHQD